jgi:hypothetical protein
MNNIKKPQQQQEKLFKNPRRAAVENSNYMPYTPQYQEMGVKPQALGFEQPIVPPFAAYLLPKSKQTPKKIPAPQNVPYAEVGSNSSSYFPGQFVNSGNNMENSWSSVDGVSMDENGRFIEMDESDMVIDNNEFDQNNWSNVPMAYHAPINERQDAPKQIRQQEKEKEERTPIFLSNIEPVPYGEYVAMMGIEVISVGSLEDVQEVVSEVLLGNHPNYSAVSPDEISVFKRMKVKIGVFVEE